MKMNAVALLAVSILTATPALAQQMHGPGHQMPMPNMPAAPGGHAGHGAMNMQGMSPAAKAFAEVNAKMHKDMTIQFSGNADVDFSRGMIPHHQGAIDMSEVVLKHGSDASVKKLASEIIAAQKKEIAQMTAWLQKNGSMLTGPDAAAVTKAFTDVNAKMHKDMVMTATGNADVDFMKGMIPHHQGAVEMAKVLLQFGKDPEIRKLADDVVRTQNDEITMMRDWLRKNGA
ncbi:MAG: CopM family metallochaperone [Bosea sp. (in: a-proteobacteria)]